MKLSLLLSTVALAVLSSQPAAAQVARPSDRAVGEMMETVQKATKDFERNMDSKVREGTIRGASTEVNVENYLKDFDTEITRMRDRFKPNYSASAEVMGVLRKAEGIDKFVKSQPPSFKGRSEWDVAAKALNDLGGAYGASFPAPADASARRMNDAEIKGAADAVTKQAQAYKKALKPAFTEAEAAALKTAQGSADALGTAAKNLSARISSSKAATGETAVLKEKVAAAQAAVTGKTLPAPAATAWKAIETAIATIDQAFGVSASAAEAAPAAKPPDQATPSQ